MLRQSKSIDLDTTDKEARSASELNESPFIVHPYLDFTEKADFVDITKTEVIHLVHWNVNRRALIAKDEIEVCVTNR